MSPRRSPSRSAGAGSGPALRLLSAADGRARAFLAAAVLLGLAVTAAILVQAGSRTRWPARRPEPVPPRCAPP